MLRNHRRHGGSALTRVRVVITGMGVVSPLGNSIEAFDQGLRAGRSGIAHRQDLADLNFRCQVAGVPPNTDQIAERYFDIADRRAMNSCMTYVAIAALDAWTNAGLERPPGDDEEVDWDTGAILGSGSSGADTIGDRVVPLTDAGKLRRMGSVCAEQMMSSNISAKVGGLLALGNQVSSNSSACASGSEAIYLALDRIRQGKAKRMLAGAGEGVSSYIWSPFDAMRVMSSKFNDEPQLASRPMSRSADGFVPGSGAGVLMLEELETASARGATILAEVLGGAVNSGGHRNGGSMTAPNPEGVQRCIREALADARVRGDEIDAISGHLTGTMADPKEIENWSKALSRSGGGLPWVTAPKSMIGHGLGAAGAVETIAAVQMLLGGYVHASLNCEDLHPEIEPYADSIPHALVPAADLATVAKAGFGFGDVNCCLILRRWQTP